MNLSTQRTQLLKKKTTFSLGRDRSSFLGISIHQFIDPSYVIYLILRLEKPIAQEVFRDARALGIRLKEQHLQCGQLIRRDRIPGPSEHQRFPFRVLQVSS